MKVNSYTLTNLPFLFTYFDNKKTDVIFGLIYSPSNAAQMLLNINRNIIGKEFSETLSFPKFAGKLQWTSAGAQLH